LARLLGNKQSCKDNIHYLTIRGVLSSLHSLQLSHLLVLRPSHASVTPMARYELCRAIRRWNAGTLTNTPRWCLSGYLLHWFS
jgi:hypothetical protein